MHGRQDPIVAIATAAGRGAVGIVRVSGHHLREFARVLLGVELQPRRARYLPLRDAAGLPIDQGLALFFEAPRSYTGEDVLELQAHGGPVVLQLLQARCLAVAQQPRPGQTGACLPGLRLAQPGEFTERAFLNGKMDLAQAEAVADLIDARTEAAARGAAQSLSGTFSQALHSLRETLENLRILVEATLDFPEEDIDFLQRSDARGRLATLREQLEQVLRQAVQGALLREGLTVVIAGQPNAGKSSLLNALAGAELAIVTPIAGTTRDRVAQTIQIEGVPLHVVDTAGLRDSTDTIEQIGIARSWEAIGQADAVLFLHDLTACDAPENRAADAVITGLIREKCSEKVPVIDVWNKSDMVPHAAADLPQLRISARTGAGLAQLRAALLQMAGWRGAEAGGFLARARHVQALRRVQAHLAQAQTCLEAVAAPLDLLAEELRLAHHALGEISGVFGADDLLGAIFSRFCIGK